MNSLTMNQTKPWYRLPLVWMLILIPFSAVVSGVIILWFAIDTNDGLVVDDYYQEGLAINQVIERDDAATRLHIEAKLEYNNATRVVKLTFNKGLLKSYPATIQLHIKHATLAKKDHKAVLQRGISSATSGKYQGILSRPLINGYWYFQISNNRIHYTESTGNKANKRVAAKKDHNNWRLTKRFKVTQAFSFMLKPLPKTAATP